MDAFLVLAACVGGHRSLVVGQSSQWSVLAFQHHDVNRVNQSVTKATSKDVQDDRVLQTEAEGARARDDPLEDDDGSGGHDGSPRGACQSSHRLICVL